MLRNEVIPIRRRRRLSQSRTAARTSRFQTSVLRTSSRSRSPSSFGLVPFSDRKYKSEDLTDLSVRSIRHARWQKQSLGRVHSFSQRESSRSVKYSPMQRPAGESGSLHPPAIRGTVKRESNSTHCVRALNELRNAQYNARLEAQLAVIRRMPFRNDSSLRPSLSGTNF